MLSELHSAEWGVSAVNGTFGRLKLPLSPDTKKRKRLLQICLHLFNFRTCYMSLNQIRTTYAGEDD